MRLLLEIKRKKDLDLLMQLLDRIRNVPIISSRFWGGYSARCRGAATESRFYKKREGYVREPQSRFFKAGRAEDTDKIGKLLSARSLIFLSDQWRIDPRNLLFNHPSFYLPMPNKKLTKLQLELLKIFSFEPFERELKEIKELFNSEFPP